MKQNNRKDWSKDSLKKLVSINAYKLTLQIEIKETNRFFKQPTWYKQNPPYDIDEIYDELMEGEVKEIIEIEKDHVLDSINSPIVNVGSHVPSLGGTF